MDESSPLASSPSSHGIERSSSNNNTEVRLFGQFDTAPAADPTAIRRECTLTLSRLELLRMLEDDEAGGKKANKTTITISLALLGSRRKLRSTPLVVAADGQQFDVPLQFHFSFVYSHYLKGGGNDLCFSIQRRKRYRKPGYRTLCAGLLSLSAVMQGVPFPSLLLYPKGDDRPLARLSITDLGSKPAIAPQEHDRPGSASGPGTGLIDVDNFSDDELFLRGSHSESSDSDDEEPDQNSRRSPRRFGARGLRNFGRRIDPRRLGRLITRRSRGEKSDPTAALIEMVEEMEHLRDETILEVASMYSDDLDMVDGEGGGGGDSVPGGRGGGSSGSRGGRGRMGAAGGGGVGGSGGPQLRTFFHSPPPQHGERRPDHRQSSTRQRYSHDQSFSNTDDDLASDGDRDTVSRSSGGTFAGGGGGGGGGGGSLRHPPTMGSPYVVGAGGSARRSMSGGDIFRSQDSVGSATSAGEADDAWDEERIPAFEHQLSSIMERDGVLHLFLVDGADLNAKRMTAELCSTKEPNAAQLQQGLLCARRSTQLHALLAAIARRTQDCREPSMVHVAVLGDDIFLAKVLRSFTKVYAEVHAHLQQYLKFYIIPVRPKQSVASQIGDLCTPYHDVFGSTEWFDAIAKSGMEADALRHVIASIDAYLHGGATVHPFEICEALLAKTQSRSRGSDVSQDAVPEQKYIPFIGSVCVGSPLQEGTASGTSLGGVQQHGTEALSELQLDYWTMPSPTDKKAKEKQSSVKATFQHLSVMRQGGLDPRGTSKVAFALEGTVRDRKGGLLELGHGKKHEKHKKGDKIAFVKALTSKLVCTAKSKISIRANVDGVLHTNVKFFSLSGLWPSNAKHFFVAFPGERKSHRRTLSGQGLANVTDGGLIMARPTVHLSGAVAGRVVMEL